MSNVKDPFGELSCDCSEGSSCCAPPSGGPSKALKTGILTVIVLLALGVSAYSLFWRDSGAGAAGCDPGAGGCGSGCAISTGIPLLDQRLIGADFGLVVIIDETEAPTTSAAIGSVAARIMATDQTMRVINLTSDDPVASAIIDKYSPASYPAVIALGGTSNATFAGAEITEDALWQTFQAFGHAAAVCSPTDNSDDKGRK